MTSSNGRRASSRASCASERHEGAASTACRRLGSRGLEPPPGTVYNYPPRGDVQPSITGYPARPDVATQIYNQSLHTIMVAKVTQGNEPIDKVVKWAEGELEGLLRT